MTRSFSVLGALAILLSAAITPVAARGVTAHTEKKPFRVGLVLDVGGVNDKSFNHLAFLGLQEAESAYHVAGNYVVSRGITDYVPNLSRFAQQHYNLVIGVGFLMQSAMYQVATQYRGVKFAMVDGAPLNGNNTQNLPNVANLFFKEQESGYLVGVMAGLMEKRHVGHAVHNTIGYMGGISIPPVNRYIAGYVAGARAVDPSIQIKSGYSQSFTDEGKGKEIGLAQISQGADILFQVAGSSGLGYLAAAQQRGKYGIGVDADQGYLGKYVMTSALKRVDVAVALTIKQTLHGRFRGGDHRFSLLNNATGFAPPARYVPRAILLQVEKYQRLIRLHAITPPAVIH